MNFIISVATIILWGFALYELAKRRGLNHTWAAWVPFANFWTLGRLSDRYNRETANKTSHHGEILLYGNIGATVWAYIGLVTILPMAIIFGGIAGGLLSAITAGVGIILAGPLGIAVGSVASFLIYAPQAVVNVFFYIAYWNVLRSCNVKYATLFMVLSIVLGIVIPTYGQLCAPIILLIYVMRKPETVEAA